MLKKLLFEFVQTCYNLYTFILHHYYMKFHEASTIAEMRSIFNYAGIKIGPEALNKWDIKIDDSQIGDFATEFKIDPSFALGKFYFEGKIRCDDVEDLAFRLCLISRRSSQSKYDKIVNYLTYYMWDLPGSPKESFSVASKFYDTGHELFRSIAGASLNLSGAYWFPSPNSLLEAQELKMSLIGKKLKIQPGMRILDIGCGMGALSFHLAKNFGAEVIGVTIGADGGKEAEKLCQGLPVNIIIDDYRKVIESSKYMDYFDRIVSVEMIEHVGYQNHDAFFKNVGRCLKKNGIFLVQTVGRNDDEIPSYNRFSQLYMTPNTEIVSLDQVIKASSRDWIIEDLHNFGYDFHLTVKEMAKNLKREFPKLAKKDNKLYTDEIFRLHEYHLLFTSGVFKSRKVQLWQIVFTKVDADPKGYASIR